MFNYSSKFYVLLTFNSVVLVCFLYVLISFCSMHHWSLQGRSSNCCDPLSDGYAFSQDENGVVSQSEVIRAYDTTKQRTNEWWAAGPIGATAAVSDGDIWSSTGKKTRRERVPPAPRRFFWDVKMKRTEGERDIELCLKKGRKKKKQGTKQNRVHFQL